MNLINISNKLLFSIGFLEFNMVDFLDVMLVTILLYNVYKLIRGSMALKVFVGFLSVYLAYLIVRATKMSLTAEILGQFMEVGVLAVIILFQQEIRKILLLIGKSTDFKKFTSYRLFPFQKNGHEQDFDIAPIIDAMKSMSNTKTGALIVLSKESNLQFYAETGDLLNAIISKRLLMSIFFKNSPLHDGACIIYKNKIVAARCILPVSENEDIPPTMGLRHRAGIGMTEVTSSAVLIVSEETGQLSYIQGGKIDHNLSTLEIRKKVRAYLLDEESEETKNLQEEAEKFEMAKR